MKENIINRYIGALSVNSFSMKKYIVLVILGVAMTMPSKIFAQSSITTCANGDVYNVTTGALCPNINLNSCPSEATYHPLTGKKCTAIITVTSPNTASSWGVNTAHDITWDKSAASGVNVKIVLYKGVSAINIVPSTPNDGSYLWTLPANLAAGSDYKIKVMSTDGKVFDFSDNFSVVRTSSTSTNPPSSSTLTVQSSVSSSTINVAQLVTFRSLVSGGNSSYRYTWSGACIGTGSTCVKTFYTPGIQTAIVTVTSGNQIASSTSSVSVATPTLLPSARITITMPTNNQSPDEVGEWMNIVWNTRLANGVYDSSAPGWPSRVKVELFKSGTLVKTIASNIANSGFFHDWLVPANFTLGTDYQIKVTDVANSNIYGMGGNFSIVAHSVLPLVVSIVNDVSSPAYVGQEQGFAASYEGGIGSYAFTWSGDCIGRGSDSHCYKTFLTTGTKTVTLRVVSGNQSVSTNYSLEVLPAIPRSITVTSPNGGERIVAGSEHVISWEASRSVGLNTTVNIVLYKGPYFQNIATNIFVNTGISGMYSWKVPANLPPGNDYKIKIVSNHYANLSDISNNTFSVVAGNSALTSTALNALNDQNVISPDGNAGDPTQVNNSSCLALANDLQYGASDTYSAGAVSKLQGFLQNHGNFSDEITGYFGNKTFTAVKSFQSENGVKTSGYVGAQTRAKIQEVSCQ